MGKRMKSIQCTGAREDVRRFLRGGAWGAALRSFILAAAFSFAAVYPSFAGQIDSSKTTALNLQGIVTDQAGNPVGDALVQLEQQSGAPPAQVQSGADGTFHLMKIPAGSYRLTARKAGLKSAPISITLGPDSQSLPLALVLGSGDGGESRGGLPAMEQAKPVTTSVMEFADNPSFAIAGVTDWTAVGGHGSDATLRTSEDLARATFAMGKDVKTGNDVTNLKDERARVDALLKLGGIAALEQRAAELDEKLGNSLAAVREFEEAARLDPSERNFFEWGSELLLHRAVWQAKEVFEKGALAYPKSARMLTGLGAALFGGARYDEAARRLCEASDLNPGDLETYELLGKVQMAAPDPLACIEPKLARFAAEHPDNSDANYLHAMSLLKREELAPNPEAAERAEALLERAVSLDGKCADGYLELGKISASAKNYPKAIDLYLKAIEANPKLGDAYYRLGVAYDRAGQHEKAMQEFDLHDAIKRQQAEEIERERREVKQFLVVDPADGERQPNPPGN